MTLHWYRPPTPSAHNLPAFLDHLHPLGVRWHADWPSAPDVMYRVRDGELLAEIGALTVFTDNQVITAWPYRGVGQQEQMVLAASAQQAFEVPPTKRAGWAHTRSGRPRWTTFIHVTVDSAGDVGRLVARHQHRMTTDALAALDVAIGREVWERPPLAS